MDINLHDKPEGKTPFEFFKKGMEHYSLVFMQRDWLPAGNLLLGALIEHDVCELEHKRTKTVHTANPLRRNLDEPVTLSERQQEMRRKEKYGHKPQKVVTIYKYEPEAAAVLLVPPDSRFFEEGFLTFISPFKILPDVALRTAKLLRFVLNPVNEDALVDASVGSVLFYAELSLLKAENPFGKHPSRWSPTTVELFFVCWGMLQVEKHKKSKEPFRYIFADEKKLGQVDDDGQVPKVGENGKILTRKEKNEKGEDVDVTIKEDVMRYIEIKNNLQVLAHFKEKMDLAPKEIIPNCLYHPQIGTYVW
eukprot:CAMPEP_0197519756 /NCGR_PEP_ID=MMETSP1318-20131121/5031_1 /TAXON_ID=552666 /ORGANISM="Partenskyella glossopodia, Strain RCC365" /LENGTH=305 /DNA_ID=CAMNT_0043070923 /DNA_START=51 /DNA_END=965 /DNA_ORIENTATION=+